MINWRSERARTRQTSSFSRRHHQLFLLKCCKLRSYPCTRLSFDRLHHSNGRIYWLMLVFVPLKWFYRYNLLLNSAGKIHGLSLDSEREFLYSWIHFTADFFPWTMIQLFCAWTTWCLLTYFWQNRHIVKCVYVRDPHACWEHHTNASGLASGVRLWEQDELIWQQIL